jgi:hypothetical protein
MKKSECCARHFEIDRPGGAHESMTFTIGHCGRCGQTLVHVATPYGPPAGSVHPITAEKHGQLVEGSEVDLEIFRERWLRE